MAKVRIAISKIAGAILLILVAASLGWAQSPTDFEKGFIPYATYHTLDFDSVSLPERNLVLHIPLISYPQRGTIPDLGLFLRYNGKSWDYVNEAPSYYRWTFTGQGVEVAGTSGFGIMNTTSPAQYQDFEVSDSNGATHIMGWTAPNVWESIDGTGIRFDSNGITDRNGIKYGLASGGVVEQDPNGNVITGNGSSLTDTLGRVIPVATFAPRTPGCVTVNFPAVNGGSAPFTFCYANYQVTSNFQYPNINEGGGTQTFLHSVTLPNSTNWIFDYNSWGDLVKITLPTGGTVTYTWENSADCWTTGLNRSVATRIFDANDGRGPKTWTYKPPYYSPGVVTDPDGNETAYYFTQFSGCTYYETKRQYYNGSASGPGLLKTVETQYASGGTNPFEPLGITNPDSYVVPILKKTTWANGQVNQVNFTYDSGTYYDANDPNHRLFPLVYGNVVQQTETDYGPGAPGVSLRQTNTQYLWQSNGSYLSANILDRPCLVTVYGPGSVPQQTSCTPPPLQANQVSQTIYGYDENNGSPQGILGNQTSVTEWLNNGASPVSQIVYNSQGMPARKIDPKGNPTIITYDSTGLFPSQIQYPDTGGIHHIEYFTHDMNTGLMISHTDQNGGGAGDPAHTTNYAYDIMGRPTSVTGPPDPNNPDPNNPGQFLKAQTIYGFNDTPFTPGSNTPYTYQQDKIDANNQTTSWTQYDGLGRVIRTAKLNGETDSNGQPIANIVDDVDTCYDGLGQKIYQTYPYQGPGWLQGTYHCPGDPATPAGDSFAYDGLGRLTAVTHVDGGKVSTDYSQFPVATVTDETGRARRNRSDALGRLLEVDEPGGSPATAASGSLTINGSLQSFVTGAQSATSGHVELTFSGTLQSKPSCSPSGQPCTDSGSVTITVAGFNKSVNYSSSTGTDSGQSVQALANAFHSDTTSPVDAIYYGADESGNIVMDLIARTTGAATNYPLSTSIVSNDPTDFPSPSFQASAGSHLIGGQDASSGGTVYDSGIVYVAAGGITASTPYGQNGNNTGALIASALVGTGSTGLNQPGSPVTATASGSTIALNYKTTGAAGNVSVNVSSSSYEPDNPSFASPGTTLSGGSNAQPLSLSTPAVTLYSYDVLDNLIGVQQQGDDPNPANWRPRSFQYDSLGRLLTATNPESGTIQYAYDANGNLTSKISPVPNQTSGATITYTYTYDELNRLTLRSRGGSFFPPNEGYQYDVATISIPGGTTQTVHNPIGRMVAASSRLGGLASQSMMAIHSYDVMGREEFEIQYPKRGDYTVNRQFSYAYNLDGSLKSITYPDGRVITYTYNLAQRPVSAGTGVIGGTSFVSDAHYTPWGALSSVATRTAFGFIGVTTNNSYNARMQPMFLSASTPSQTVLNLSYDYNSCNGNGGNNGNVCQLINNKIGQSARSQTFQYDPLNRLLSATSRNWSQSYTYDIWGNLLHKTAVGGDTPLDKTVTVKNQVDSWCYDAAGNVVDPNQPCPTPAPNSYPNVYDGENRLTQTTVGGVTTAYDYDADGKRIKKLNASGTGTLYWYGSGGEVLEETDLDGNLLHNYVFFGGKRIARWEKPACTGICRPPNSAPVYYYFSDHLGSADVVTDAAGNIQEESDYYPFGGERVVTDLGIGNNYKFTGKERDPETGLDNFGARYNASAIGRFITADPFNPLALKRKRFQAWISNPQRWNKYSYALNNPVTLIDPDGMNACGTKDDKDCIVTIFLTDRTKDKNGKYNDKYKNVKNQASYNATAMVVVSNLATGKTTNAGTFLARTEPSDTDRFPTAAAGGYNATLTTHSGHLAIRLQPTNHIPIVNDVNPAHPDRDYASGILVHISGLNNFTGMTRAGGGVSEGCQLICRSQYDDFLSATGLSADPPQRHFSVIISTTPNMQPGVEREDDEQ